MSRVSYPVFMVDDRIVFQAEDKYALFDTGFPRSTSPDGKIGQFKAAAALPNGDGNVGAFLADFLRLEMPDQAKVTAIFNPMDGYNCFLTPENITITDESEAVPDHDYFLPFADARFPIVEGSMNGVPSRFFFDSGARMTMFGDMAQTGGKPAIGSYKEWMAMLFRYEELPLYDAVLEFPCGLRFNSKGALVNQPEYAGAYRMMNLKAMLGIDFLKEYNIYFSMINAQRGLAFAKR